MKTTTSILCLLMIGASGAALAAPPSPFAATGQPVVVGNGYDFPSKILGEKRRVNVLLPPGYSEEKQRETHYPVLYLLDGGADWQDFIHIAGMIHQGNTWGANAQLIVVGIESKDRKAEFTQPSSVAAEQKDFPTHGKSEQFRRFLVEELKPAVEAAYRTDGTSAIMGESLAALFVVDTALRHGSDFDRYIAISPSLWWDHASLAAHATTLLAKPGPKARRLWLSMADEGGTMQGAMDQLVAALKKTKDSRLDWSYTPYPHEQHNTIYHPAATRAVRDVFPPPPPPPAK